MKKIETVIDTNGIEYILVQDSGIDAAAKFSIITNDIESHELISRINGTESVIRAKFEKHVALLEKMGLIVSRETTGETANKFKFHSRDRCMTMFALVDELESALKERL